MSAPASFDTLRDIREPASCFGDIMATDDDSDVPESGGVFTFGKSKFADNVPSKFWVRNDRVVEVACGDEHTALVAESGRIFTFGANDWGQLGLGHSKTMFKPSCVKSLKSEKVRAVGCGRSSTYVATESGRLYSFGANSEGQLGSGNTEPCHATPRLMKNLESTRIKMISGGTDHAAALTEDGKVYMWGGGSEGQLGLGDVTEAVSPKELDMDEKVVCVSCGYYHTALVTASGTLYTFGEGEGGKLGLGEDTESQSTPQEVAAIKGKVTWVACGGMHTVAITSDGRVYTFGEGSNGQLGHGNIQLQATSPQEVFSLRDTKIRRAACGENHTAVLSEKGVLFTFGDGRHGKLGLGEENFANQFKPSPVTRFGAFTVEKVDCGGCHMLVLAKPKMQNGDASDSGTGEEENSADSMEHQRLLKPTSLDVLRRSDDFDLSGSFSARNRRREKQDPLGSMSRTLPPLNSSFSSRSLPPLGGGLSASSENPLNRSMLPPLKKPVASRRRGRFSNSILNDTPEEAGGDADRQKDEDSIKESDDSSETNHRKAVLVKEAREEVKTAPVPIPRLTPRINPRHSTVQPTSQEKEVRKDRVSESSEEESESGSKERKPALKPVRQTDIKASPTPKPRFARRQLPSKDEGSEYGESEGSEEKKEQEKKEEKPSFRKKKPERETEDTEEDNDRSKRKTSKGKENDNKKDKARAKKKRGGLFGRKKMLESDDEEEEDDDDESEEESEDSEEKRKSKNKKDKKEAMKGKDKGKGKEKEAVSRDKQKKKGKYSEEEDEEDESEEEEDTKMIRKDKGNDKNKDKGGKSQGKKNSEEEGSSETDVIEKNKEKSKDKDKWDEDDKKKKPEEKKSKLCSIL